MINAAFNIFIYTAIFFVVGMIRPQFALFFMSKPDRFMVLIFSVIGFMVGATLFGEGNRQKQLETQVQMQKQAPQITKDPAEIPLKPAPTQ